MAHLFGPQMVHCFFHIHWAPPARRLPGSLHVEAQLSLAVAPLFGSFTLCLLFLPQVWIPAQPRAPFWQDGPWVHPHRACHRLWSTVVLRLWVCVQMCVKRVCISQVCTCTSCARLGCAPSVCPPGRRVTLGGTYIHKLCVSLYVSCVYLALRS